MACGGCKAGTKKNCCDGPPFPWAKSHHAPTMPEAILQADGCRKGKRKARVMRQGRMVWACVTGVPAGRRIVTITGIGDVPQDALVTTAAPHGLQVDDQVTLSSGDPGVYNGGWYDISEVPSSTTFRLFEAYVSDTAGGSWQRVTSA